MKKRKKIIILNHVDRCPMDKKPALFTKCDRCQFRGSRWIVDMDDRPRTIKTECLYKKTDQEAKR
jgi:hypothetical protein